MSSITSRNIIQKLTLGIVAGDGLLEISHLVAQGISLGARGDLLAMTVRGPHDRRVMRRADTR